MTLLLGPRAVLFGSRDARLYDVPPGSCGVVAREGNGCRALITANGAAHAGAMGVGTIHGRGWATLPGGTVSWWELARQAKLTKLNQSCPRPLQLTRADDATPTASGCAARRTFTWCTIISTADDDVAIKAGSSGPTTNVSVLHNHFHTGHGVSIGSETNGGASAVLVRDLTIHGADDGLRIKSNASRGGLVRGVTYADVCIRNTKNVIEMDTHYTALERTEGTLIPKFRDLVLRGVRIEGKGRAILEGYDAARPLGITFDGVQFDDPAKFEVRASHTMLTRDPAGTNLAVAGDGVKVPGAAASPASTRSCAERWVPRPVR